jgi:chemotaxis protein MotB
MADLEQPVIVKKVKVAANEHHGGAWKVAYADFVTAMMAFFLLLWLLNASEQEVLDGLSNYFTPTTFTTSDPSGSNNVFGGTTPNEPGPDESKVPQSRDTQANTTSGNLSTNQENTGAEDTDSTGSAGEINADDEQRRFDQAKQNLEAQLSDLPVELAALKETFKIDITKEGLRIQLVDSQDRENFQRGTDELTNQAEMALRLLTDIAITLPNPISITGHTGTGETATEPENWELSVDRANAVRRGLTSNGLPTMRVDSVIGVADSDPLIPDNPDSPQNRRMSIVLLRQAEIP